jgi:hypothetical protein
VSGETDLGRLLRALVPHLDDRIFAFGVIPHGRALPAGLSAIGTVEEDEGLTVIAPLDQLAAAAIEHSGPLAKISLTVHSSLEAVGLTAAVSAALAHAGISANVVAGYFHDHIFVPWDRREDAVTELRALSAGKTPI